MVRPTPIIAASSPIEGDRTDTRQGTMSEPGCRFQDQRNQALRYQRNPAQPRAERTDGTAGRRAVRCGTLAHHIEGYPGASPQSTEIPQLQRSVVDVLSVR